MPQPYYESAFPAFIEHLCRSLIFSLRRFQTPCCLVTWINRQYYCPCIIHHPEHSLALQLKECRAHIYMYVKIAHHHNSCKKSVLWHITHGVCVCHIYIYMHETGKNFQLVVLFHIPFVYHYYYSQLSRQTNTESIISWLVSQALYHRDSLLSACLLVLYILLCIWLYSYDV